MASPLSVKVAKRRESLIKLIDEARFNQINKNRANASAFTRTQIAQFKERVTALELPLRQELDRLFDLGGRYVVYLDTEKNRVQVVDTANAADKTMEQEINAYMETMYPPMVIEYAFPYTEKSIFNKEIGGMIAWINVRRSEIVSDDTNHYFDSNKNILAKISAEFNVDFEEYEAVRKSSIEKLTYYRNKLNRERGNVVFRDDFLQMQCGVPAFNSIIDKYIAFYESRLDRYGLVWRDGDSAMEPFVVMHDYLASEMGIKFSDMHYGDESILGQMTLEELHLIRDITDYGVAISNLILRFQDKMDQTAQFVWNGIQRLYTERFITAEEALSLDGIREVLLAANVYMDSRRDARFSTILNDLYDNVGRIIQESTQPPDGL